MTKEFNQSNHLLALSLRRASQADIDDLWSLFQRYHEEVSRHLGEKPRGTEEKFKQYWMPSKNRASFLLVAGNSAVGFVLTQIVSTDGVERLPALEVGAVYVIPPYRLGRVSLTLYEAVIAEAKSQSLPIVSEVARGNGHSLRLIKALSRRHKSRIRDFQILSTDEAIGRYKFRCTLAGLETPKPLGPRSCFEK